MSKKDKVPQGKNIINNHHTKIYIIGAPNNLEVSDPTTGKKVTSLGKIQGETTFNANAQDESQNLLLNPESLANSMMSPKEVNSKAMGIDLNDFPESTDRQKFLGPNIVITPAQTGREERMSLSPRRDEPRSEGEDFSRRTLKSMPSINDTSVHEGFRSQHTLAASGDMYVKRKSKSSLFDCLKSKKRSTLRGETINLIGDQIRKRHILAQKFRHARQHNGRLLSIIAKQAVKGRDPMISKKLNPEALEKARKEYMNKKKNKTKKYIKKFLRWVKGLSEPFKPDHAVIVYWKLIVMITILMEGFVSTYIQAFVDENTIDFGDKTAFTSLIGDIIYVFDIILNFHTAYYYHGELRSSRKDIVAHYLKTYFMWDIISILGIPGILFPTTFWHDLLFFNLLRLYHVPGYMNRIEDYFQFNKYIGSIVKLLKLSLIIFIFAHIFACIFYAVTLVETDEQSWLQNDDMNLIGRPIEDIYIASLYYSITTMATVGYGDIYPRSKLERVVAIAIMIMSSIVFGYTLSSMGSIITDLSNYSSEAREKMRVITKYMNEKGLAKDTQNRIRKYLEFYLDKENTMRTESEDILHFLSDNLKDEIIKEVNAKILCDCYMFSSNFRRKFLYTVSRSLIEKSYGPDEIIFHQNDEGDQSVYFITSGKVDIFYERCDMSLQKLSKGHSFGGIAFFSGNPRTSSARSLEFTTVFYLPREKFIQKLVDFPIEKVQFCCDIS